MRRMEPSLGTVRVLVTHEARAHPAALWAATTADHLVSVDPLMPAIRMAKAVDLRARIERHLTAVFECAGGADAAALTEQAWVRIVDEATGTPWALSFQHPAIARMMKSVVERNLRTAALHLAAR